VYTALKSAPLPLPRGFSAAALDAAVAATKQRSLGLTCLFGNCACMAVFLTLQESLLARVGSPLRVTLLSYAFGTAMLVVALLCGAGGGTVQHASRWALPQHARSAVIYAGVIASGLNYVLLVRHPLSLPGLPQLPV
jgi:drug/metabolite transporter (DMT)-like permease